MRKKKQHSSVSQKRTDPGNINPSTAAGAFLSVFKSSRYLIFRLDSQVSAAGYFLSHPSPQDADEMLLAYEH